MGDIQIEEVKEKGVWATMTIHQMPMLLKDRFWAYARDKASGNPKAALEMLLDSYEWHKRMDTIEERLASLEIIPEEEVSEEETVVMPKTFGSKK